MITSVKLVSTSSIEQVDVPVTFGQVFAVGDLKATESLVGLLADGSSIPLQLDVKASHADGSVRHAVISCVLPKLAAGAEVAVSLMASPNAPVPAERPYLRSPSAAISASVEGAAYSAKAPDGAKEAGAWLAGPIANDWHVKAPLLADNGAEHPHLCARFAIRTYSSGRSRVEVVVENAWAYELAPRNFIYDASVVVEGQVVEQITALEHYHHARWRRVYWVGGEPQLHIKHDAAYLIASGALPNYDTSVRVSDTVLAGYLKNWNDATVGPMKIGSLVNAYMPSTGGRNDLGLLPGWAAAYLISQDPRAKQVTLGTAEMAGSWSMHYRDKKTDLPISLLDYPYMTIYGIPTDTRNPATKLLEAFPKLVDGKSSTPYSADTSHQPAFAYLPYLVTGEHYHLEELQFWAMRNVFGSNPGYRQNIRGLLIDQVRGQAWSLRTLGEAAYITPDAHPLKSHFLTILDSNLNWYNDTYSNNPNANKLGVLEGSGAVIYSEDTNGDGVADPKTAVAPWQDDFFTSAVGHVAELGFTKAEPLLRYKAKFPIGRMIGDGFCSLIGANYTIAVRPTENAPDFDTFAQAYAATVPELVGLPNDDAVAIALGRKPGDMGGYSSSETGFPSNMQPALAYAAGTGEAGRRAWERFISRSIKPNYGLSPQFAILPRAPKEAVKAPEPVPVPQPEPVPQPTPVPTHEPVPAPTPTPVPAPNPDAAPTPAPAPGTIKGPSNVKLKGKKGLRVTVFAPTTLGAVRDFAGVAASTKGVIVVTDASLVAGTQYAASIADATGAVLDVMYPLKAV